MYKEKMLSCEMSRYENMKGNKRIVSLYTWSMVSVAIAHGWSKETYERKGESRVQRDLTERNVSNERVVSKNQRDQMKPKEENQRPRCQRVTEAALRLLPSDHTSGKQDPKIFKNKHTGSYIMGTHTYWYS